MDEAKLPAPWIEGYHSTVKRVDILGILKRLNFCTLLAFPLLALLRPWNIFPGIKQPHLTWNLIRRDSVEEFLK